MEELKIGEILIEYDAGNVRIVDSYKVKKEEDMLEVLIWFKLKTGFRSRRSMDSWIREWKAHNIMYKLGIYRSHSRDCDLEELEKWHRRLVYWFIGR